MRRGKRRYYRLRARLSEPARLRVLISRRKKGRWRTKRLITRRVKKGVNRVSLGRLRKKGRYRVRVRAIDLSGNSSKPKAVRFRIRR